MNESSFADDARDPLDAGLQAGFGGEPRSVLDVVERTSGSAPKVLPRDAPSEHGGSPMLLRSEDPPALPRWKSNYQVLGEIARGGMGVILKGHDTDLGRDVAMKVLDPGLSRRPEIMQRFIEEAQIGGQLQHPGIVPVYELGLMTDSRPYFTMKLVKGRTLAAQLAERPSSDESQRALLDAFEAVCQTMAYAHSRSVIHRDLKPANVMVGAFGEVQVVDWGLAKVLPTGGTADELRASRTHSSISVIETVRSDPGKPGSKSVVGSVMGTPAYMPPEQARGEVEELDEHSDVFSLGAILCEILTGAPPYLGSHAEAIVAAAAADLGGALQRLESCTGDPALVALTRECLAPARAARPRSAEVVARRVHEHFVAVEERARSAQIEAAEARIQARAERKARRLTVALAACVLLALVGGGGSWIWIAGRRWQREVETDGKIAAALADAERAREGADWTSALAGIERAKALADAPEASSSSRESVALLAAEVQREVAEARSREALALDGEELLSELEDVSRPGGDLFFAADREILDAGFEESFARHGLDPFGSPIDAAASELAARAHDLELAVFLDEWSSFCREDAERSARLQALAGRLDPDQARGRIRAALAADDVAALRALGAETNARTAPAATSSLLGRALLRKGDHAEAIRLRIQAQQAHPQDFLVAMDLAQAFEASPGDGASHAARHYEAASVLRPRSIEARHKLGTVLDHSLGEHDEAVRIFEAALELRPGDAHLRWHLARALDAGGRSEQAVPILIELVERDPGDTLALSTLGRAQTESGRPAEAIDYLRRAVEITPRDARLLATLGRAQLALGDLDAAVETYRTCVELAPDDADHLNALGAIHHERGELDEAIQSYELALEIAPEKGMVHYNLALSRRAKGDMDEALASYRRAAALEPREAGVQSGLAAALVASGANGAAMEVYRRVLEIDPSRVAAHNNVGALLQGEGRLEEALACYQRALEIDASDALVHLNVGDVLRGLGHDVEAIASYREAIRHDPGLLAAHHHLGLALLAVGELDLAIESLRHVVEVGPDEAAVLNELAWALATHPRPEARRPAEAVELAHRAVALEAGVGTYWNTLGVALFRAGDPAACIDALEESMELRSGGDPYDWLFHAMADHALGRPDEARRWLERSVAWLPGQPASAELERLVAETKALLGESDDGNGN